MEKLSNLLMESQTTYMYYFNLVFFAANLLLNFETITSESSFTCRFMMFILMTRLMPSVIPIFWITKEIMSRGPHVEYMECRDTT
jgi:hypothetical protein